MHPYNPVPGIVEGMPSSNDYNGGFGVSLMLKDMKLAKEISDTLGINNPLADIVIEDYEDLEEKGLGMKDFGIIYKELVDRDTKKEK